MAEFLLLIYVAGITAAEATRPLKRLEKAKFLEDNDVELKKML